jgi:hypothetical protein
MDGREDRIKSTSSIGSRHLAALRACRVRPGLLRRRDDIVTWLPLATYGRASHVAAQSSAGRDPSPARVLRFHRAVCMRARTHTDTEGGIMICGQRSSANMHAVLLVTQISRRLLWHGSRYASVNGEYDALSIELFALHRAEFRDRRSSASSL